MLSARWFTRNVNYTNCVRAFATAKTAPKAPKTEPAKTKSKSEKSLLEQAVASKPKMVDLKSTMVDLGPKAATESKPISNDIFKNIEAATTVDGLLNFVNKDQNVAKKILSKLSVWMQQDQIRASDFVSDTRFLTVCNVLAIDAETIVQSVLVKKPVIQSRQLDTIIGIASDKRAADICEALPIEQNLQVLAGLAKEKSRSIIVLRTIAQKINEYAGDLNLRDCSSIFYAMASLQFENEVLLAKVGEHVLKQLQSNTDKMAVVGSIITSLGKLRYRDGDLLNALTGWIIERHTLCRTKDLVSMLMTLALVNFPSEHTANIRSTILPLITRSEISAGEWLNYVWSLSVLGLQEPQHLESVLG